MDAPELAEQLANTLASRSARPLTATYRLQFQPEHLTFNDATALTPYLQSLGVSHLYASPCRKARSGGSNAYAIVDYGQLDPQLGREEDYRAMVDALHASGLGQLMDIVPNHMSATPGENPWWSDVLENGPSAPHASYFDIDWRPVKEELRNRILLPILGNQYGQVLEAGELKLEYRHGAFFVRYFKTLLPLEPRTYRTILARKLDELKGTRPADCEDVRELESILTALEHLPPPTRTDPASVAERQREKEVVKVRLRKLVEQTAAIAEFIERNLQELNGLPDDPHSFDALNELLDAQVYRLCHWKAADDEINYRRFFDINDLAAVCTEAPQVFTESHQIIFDLLVRDAVDGLRVDHIDGLYDPLEYLRRLQQGYALALGKAAYDKHLRGLDASVPGDGSDTSDVGGQGANAAWSEVEPALLQKIATMLPDRCRRPLYVVAEKILGRDEPLPEHWPLDGTTGYDFLNLLNGLFVDREGFDALTTIYCRFTGQRPDFREVAQESKTLILKTSMASNLQMLAQQLNRLSSRRRRSRDFTLNSLRTALREIIACFPVYRTYIRRGEVSDRDRQVVSRAVAQAKRRNPATNGAVFDFIRDILLLQSGEETDEAGRREAELFVGRFQQLTSPVLAKGIEDTAFYRWFPLASLSEVGGEPARGVTDLDEFHRRNAQRQQQWPRSLLASTTHDTKRSEDVRARLNVLSEIPVQWRAAVNRWARLNRRHRAEVDGEPAPSRNDEYLFYQSLLGIWPLEKPDAVAHDQITQRMQQYMEKAVHEAKVHTSWINPNADYEAAVRAFVTAALDASPRNRFLADFQDLHGQIANWGLYAALSQTLLKLTAPGVPDLYQGQELWDFSLVDPDNRRPVDFPLRRELLTRLEQQASDGDALRAVAGELARNPRDPRTKLFLVWRTLQFRRRHIELFQAGDYVPLAAQGANAENVCAFARRLAASSASSPSMVIVVAPRWFAKLTPLALDARTARPPLGHDVWGDTRLLLEPLPSAIWNNVLTGEGHSPQEGCLRIGDVLAEFPVGLLMNVVSE
ncbi:MAG: malto-oligosyltrehalose synthase [Planctomycetaceae bacterium]|nr:malto-oligosyltrehalose synthase [Planctomycetaceae bacterium]